MVTNAGGGYSRRQHLAHDALARGHHERRLGQLLYVRDLDNGDVWSTTHQPTGREAEEYEATFAPDRAVWRRVDAGLETRTEIVVSPEDDAELRRVSVTNHSHRARSLELTSYAEVVLAPADADLAHPAFSNLFIETTAVPERDALICARRPRAGTDRVYLVHVLSGRGRIGAATEYETDRARFIGRGRHARPIPARSAAAARSRTRPAPVLDPIVSLRQSIRLPPGGTARLAFTTGFADSEAGARHLIEKYHDRRAVARAHRAGQHARADRAAAPRPDGRGHDAVPAPRRPPPLRRSAAAIAGRGRGRTAAASRSCGSTASPATCRSCWCDSRTTASCRSSAICSRRTSTCAARAWCSISSCSTSTPRATGRICRTRVQQMVESGPEQAWIDRPGGVFLRRADLMPPEDQLLLRAAARAVMDGADGGLRQQLVRPQCRFEPLPDADEPAAPRRRAVAGAASPRRQPDLESFNGLGGFATTAANTSSACSRTPASFRRRLGQRRRAPDVRVRRIRSRHRLHLVGEQPRQPADAVAQRPGRRSAGRSGVHPGRRDAAASGRRRRCPRAAASPTRPPRPGLLVYEHARDGIESRLLRVRRRRPNRSRSSSSRCATRRAAGGRLSVTLYVEWVLGENRSRTAPARRHQPRAGDRRADRLATRFATSSRIASRSSISSAATRRTLTGDRTEFIGRNGSLRAPGGARPRRPLGPHRRGARPVRRGPGQVTLEPSRSRRHRPARRSGRRRRACRRSSAQPRRRRASTAALRRGAGLLGSPARHDAGHDARSRDGPDAQPLAALSDAGLPDLGPVGVLPVERRVRLPRSAAGRARAAARRAAPRARAHPARRVAAVRRRRRPALVARAGRPGRAHALLRRPPLARLRDAALRGGDRRRGGPRRERAVPRRPAARARTSTRPTSGRPSRARSASLYEHCVRAIELSLATGAHGLPLMGTGDWNDGMNLVGASGKGESVWLGWFLLSILRPFADLAAARGETRPRRHAIARHATALDERARAGLGWRMVSPRLLRRRHAARIAGERRVPHRRDRAVVGGDRRRRRSGASAPGDGVGRRSISCGATTASCCCSRRPSTRMTPSPGYIQGYVPGVRENGGQYTHAALWTVLAFAQLGDGDRAAELFAMLNPINHTRDAGRRPALSRRALRRRGRRLLAAAAHRPRRLDVVHGLGRLDVSRRASKRSSASRSATARCTSIRAFPRTWPGYEMIFKCGRVEIPHHRREPGRRESRRGAARSGRRRAHRQDIAIVDDGPVHQGAGGAGVAQLRRHPCEPGLPRQVEACEDQMVRSRGRERREVV